MGWQVLNAYPRIEQISKYIMDNENLVSHCQRKELEIRKDAQIFVE